MKKYLAQLRPLERRLVVGVAVGLVLILNWAFIWPHFSDFSNFQIRFNNATIKLRNYRAAVAETPDLQKKVKTYESEGEYVALADQSIDLMRTIQSVAAASGFGIQGFSSRPTIQTNQFFVEQMQNIQVVAPEANLVDFLYKLGNSPSMIRVLDLTLQPDQPRQRLSADIRLVASYQKNLTASAAKNATAKAK
jgi:type II secretory pathway component PulM